MNHIGWPCNRVNSSEELEDRSPRIVTFGGGKGGAGRSTLCAEVARSLARRDEQVFCLDADWSCPSLDTLLHLERSERRTRDRSNPPIESGSVHIGDVRRPTQTEGIELAHLASERAFPFARPNLEPTRLIEELRELDLDWVLIDLPPGFDPLAVGLFVLSDIPLMISTPEPISVRKTTQFLRSGLFHAIEHHTDDSERQASLQDLLYEQPLELSASTLLEDASDALEPIVEEALELFEPYLVVNFVREGAEQDLGYVLCHAWHREIGIYPRFVNPIDYEDRRWFYHRRSTGEDAVRGEETRSRDIEKLTQSLLEIEDLDETYPRPIPREDIPHPALQLGLSPDRNRNRIRQHCRRLWEGYGREDAIEIVFTDPSDREHITDELENLYREVLTLPSDEFNTNSEPSDEEAETLEPVSSPVAHEPEGGHGSSRMARNPDHASEAERATATSSPDEEAPRASNVDRDDDVVSTSETLESRAEVESFPEEGGEAESPERDPETGDTPDETIDEPTATDEPSRDSSDDAPPPDWMPSSEAPPGRIIELLRHRESVGLQELSLRSRVGLQSLTALEDGDLERLPRPDELRDYLGRVARCFEVEPERVIEAYLDRLERSIEP